MDEDRALAKHDDDRPGAMHRETMTGLLGEIKRIVPLLRGTVDRRTWDDLSLDEKDARLHDRP